MKSTKQKTVTLEHIQKLMKLSTFAYSVGAIQRDTDEDKLFCEASSKELARAMRIPHNEVEKAYYSPLENKERDFTIDRINT